MADSDLAGFGYDARAMRYSYSPRTAWPAPAQPQQIDSPQRQNIGANANAVKRSTTPLHNQPISIQPMVQQCSMRPQSQGYDQGYNRLLPQQNQAGLPPQLPTQSHLQVEQQIGQQHGYPAQYRYPSKTYDHQPMNPHQNPQVNDQSNPADWSYSQQAPSSQSFPLNTSYAQDLNHQNYIAYSSSPVDLLSGQHQFGGNLGTMDNSYLAVNNDMDAVSFNWHGFDHNILSYPSTQGMPNMSMGSQGLPNSPTDTSLEVRSLSSSDNGWGSVEYAQGFDGSYDNNQAIFNPGETLHGRTFSDSSYSDVENQTRGTWGSYVEVNPHAIGSPSSDGASGFDPHHEVSDINDEVYIKQEKLPTPILSSSTTAPIKIEMSKSPERSPLLSRKTSPGRKPQWKSSIKTTKAAIKRQSPVIKGENDKRIGRRRGPLRPEQRKQASEIRKLGACLRCKFLKKTCDKGEPCQGCLPSHARLWQVPCTRIDIKEIAYFMRDWKADYERHVSLGISIDNIKGFASPERMLYITHGYGHLLPVRAREVFVRDERCFGLDWVETIHDLPTAHKVNTARLSAGMEGVSVSLLSDYLDAHIDSGFENFIDEYFGGTPFVTDMLKTIYHYYLREKTNVIKKALKFLLAYNLTQHVTMVEGIPQEENFLGRILDTNSKFYGKTVAPVMIHFQVKIAMANMWRELQKDILEELSTMYSSVYSKEKLKNWPTIFMVACILLAVWEEMQFDCHYRVPDKDAVNQFCADMESIPVKVVVGLFHAISQKLPALQEWETRKHHFALPNSNPAVCDALTQVRQHVTRHDQYLRSRCDTKFDCDDFDSLSSKFMSKLVIRSPAS